MTFSKSWGYGVRALVRLAGTYEDPEYRWQAGELADAAKLPSSFLSKVLHQLTSAGLVDSARGRGGGVRLAAPPEDIRLIDIARATEDTDALNLAAAGFEEATEELRKAIQERWRPYERGMLEFLAETTIADLLRSLPPQPAPVIQSDDNENSEQEDEV